MRIALHLAQRGEPEKEKSILPASLAGLGKHKPDVVLFPEQFVFFKNEADMKRMEALCREAGAPFIVPGLQTIEDDDGGKFSFQLARMCDPTDGWYEDDERAKHTSKGNQFVTLECEDWQPEYSAGFPYKGRNWGVTICHDLYLGGLYRWQARQGAEALLNATYFKVQDAKWGVLARLRALENARPMLVCLHADGSDAKHHPYAYDADGQELEGTRLSDGARLPAGKMCGGGETFVVDVPAIEPRDRKAAVKALPICRKNEQPNVSRPGSEAVKFVDGRLFFERHGEPTDIVEAPGMKLLDIKHVFEGLLAAHRKGRKAVVWNPWTRLDVSPDRWLHVMLGRSLEFSVPVILTEGDRILEITERASDHKQIRRCSPGTSRAWVDLARAHGLARSFNITTEHFLNKYREEMFELMLNRYRQLFV